MSWWGMDLDPVVMSATLLAIGVSVDFTAHVTYHYQHTIRYVFDENEGISDKVSNATLVLK